MLKICSPQLGMYHESSLGGEIYDYQTIKGFCSKGFKVLVYLPKGRPYDKTLKNLKVDFAPIKHVVPPWLYSFLMLPYLFKTYSKENFNVLRIHSPRFLGLGALIFHYFHKDVPILLNAVNVDDSKFFYLIEKATFNIASGVIVQSQYMKKRVINRYKINPTKIAVTYGGILESKIAPKKAFYKLDKDAFVILFMGVMVKRKNPRYLFEVHKKVIKKVPKVKLVFIGTGPEQIVLRELVKKLKLEDVVIFVNQAYGEEKAFWLSRMNVFALPSLDEGFGLAVTEAMTYGKPVLTSDRAAFKEIIKDNSDGFAISLSNKKRWVSTIIALAKSPRLAKKIGMAGQKKVKRVFNWKKTANLNKEFIESIVK